MTATALAEALNDALQDPHPRESEHRVKTAVAQALESFDSTATVRTTTYFNHTFAPDLVLSWGRRERPVFLRFTDDVPALAEDIDILDPSDPMVFGLSTLQPRQAAEVDLSERARRAEIFFADPAAIEALTDRGDATATDRMLRNSLTQGGVGALVGEDDATNLANAVSSGFEAAAQTSFEGTGIALDVISEKFKTAEGMRLTRVMQAVWEGAGGRLDQFPGVPDLSGRLNDVSLLYLMEFMHTQDVAFWRGVGREIDIDQLLTLKAVSGQENFQSLINANLDVLHARACLVLDMSFMDGDEARDLRWAIHQRTGEPPVLALRGNSFQAFAARTKDDLTAYVPQDARPGLTVNDFVARASLETLAAVEISVGGRHMSLSRDEQDLTEEFIRDTTENLTQPLVDKATVRTPTGRVVVDFTRSTGTGVTRSDTRMTDLMSVTIPLIVEQGSDGREELAALLALEGTVRDLRSDVDSLFGRSFEEIRDSGREGHGEG